MVYFNCTKCGTGLKKPQVATHMAQCRSRVVSCIDCQKDFRDEEFKSHVKCMTEMERYESKTYVAKANKGDLKQNAWIEKIGRAVEVFTGSAKAKSLLEKLVDYPNVPRKKAKFVNFVRNSFRFMAVSDPQLDEIWSVIEAIDKKPEPSNNGVTNTNGTKRKLEDDENTEPVIPLNPGSDSKFDWLDEIKKVCSKRDNLEVPLDKLERKLYKKYRKREDGDDGEEDGEAKFKKKLGKKLKKLSSSISLISAHNGDQSIMVVRYLNDE